MKTKKERITSWSNFVDTMFIDNTKYTPDESMKKQEAPVTMKSFNEDAPEHVSVKLQNRPEDDKLIMMDFAGAETELLMHNYYDHPYTPGVGFAPSEGYLMAMQIEDKIARNMRKH